ncbi:sensor histidine kinase [Isobaculum melis]|uniref:histidine kinase n=1 Tax=Isobaculum melis TaxID=142588 RepID=A0A1H9RJY1_9LACT|nr:sensor histidine kinase [Isobaculum melis]SER72249.1 hypothetical protein SAMN04488559_10450 [Isobaculum melis]
MNILKYLKDQLLLITFWCFHLMIILLILFLDHHLTFQLNNVIYLTLLSLFFFIIFLTGFYFYKKSWYQAIKERKSSQKDGLFLPLEEARSEEQKMTQEYVNKLLLYHQEAIAQLEHEQIERKDFIDSWVHDIKLPLTATGLILETIEEDISEKNFLLLEEETRKISYYVEQVLYYSRLDAFSKDYLIQETPLHKVINTVIRENAPYFIQKKLTFKLVGEDFQVLTDEKWLRFVLAQIVSNAIKYTPAHGEISISLEQNQQGIWLSVTDTGIGIPPEDQKRIFDKGFTGANGRNEQHHSTGIGLYLAKNLSKKLGHELFVTSELDKGTTIQILFPFLTFYNDHQGNQLEIQH